MTGLTSLNMKYLMAILITIFGTACAHQRSILPDVRDVQVSRKAADPKCRALGEIEGRAPTASGTSIDALADLKREAAAKGANYLVVKEYSTYGTAVTALAYECP